MTRKKKCDNATICSAQLYYMKRPYSFVALWQQLQSNKYLNAKKIIIETKMGTFYVIDMLYNYNSLATEQHNFTIILSRLLVGR